MGDVLNCSYWPSGIYNLVATYEHEVEMEEFGDNEDGCEEEGGDFQGSVFENNGICLEEDIL